MTRLSDVNLLAIGNTITLGGAFWVGEGKCYVVPLPEYRETLESLQSAAHGTDPALVIDEKSGEEMGVTVLSLSAEDWKVFLRQTDLKETEVLQAAGEDGKLAKAIIRKSQRQISQHVSWQVFRRDGYKCRYCGADDVPLTVDHLVTWEEGGPTETENLLSSCKRCNNKRGSTPYAEWLQSPYYRKASQNLSADVRRLNNNIAQTLDQIPRLTHRRSSR